MSAKVHTMPAPPPAEPGRLVRVPEPVRLPGFRVVPRGTYRLDERTPEGVWVFVPAERFGWWGPDWLNPATRRRQGGERPPPSLPGAILIRHGEYDAVFVDPEQAEREALGAE